MTRIYISQDRTKATVVNIIGNSHSYTSKQSIFTICGDRWVTPLECIINDYPDSEILYEDSFND